MARSPHSPTCRERILRWSLPLFLALLTAGIWCVQNRRLTAESWQYPLTFSGDTMEILVRLKAVSSGELLPFHPQKLERLGAPFGADWSEYPVSDKLLFLVFGNVARLIGPNAAGNLAVLMAAVTSALSFYGCARFLRAKRLWSFTGALLFAFTYQAAARSLPHLWLAYSYTVPLALLTSWLLASSHRLGWRTRNGKLCLATSAIVGASNPYNLFLYLQLLSLSFVGNLFNKQRRQYLGFTLACLAAALATWAIFQSESWLNPPDEGAAPLIVRNYSGTEVYALKPVELCVPPVDHHSSVFASLGHRYLRWAAFKGETFYPYLGIVGLLGLLWLSIDFARQVSRNHRRKLTAHGPQIGWILLYSAPGGINGVVALLFGLQIFRATNRFSIFISGIILLFVVSRLSRLTRAWPFALQIAAAVMVATLGLWDEIPMRRSQDYVDGVKTITDSDAAMGRAIDANLPANALVFQLPVEDFPESPPESGVPEYEHFRPYLHTASARFTYGTLKQRAVGQWQHDYEKLAPAAMVEALERAGFAGVFIDRRGYADQAASLRAALLQAGGREIWNQNEFLVVALNPKSPAQAPLASEPTFGHGWYKAEGGDRWAYGDATLSYFNPYPTPLTASLKLSAKTVDERTLTLSCNGRSLATGRLNATSATLANENFILLPGINRFSITTEKPPIRVSEARYGLRAFCIENLTLQILSNLSPAPPP